MCSIFVFCTPPAVLLSSYVAWHVQDCHGVQTQLGSSQWMMVHNAHGQLNSTCYNICCSWPVPLTVPFEGSVSALYILCRVCEMELANVFVVEGNHLWSITSPALCRWLDQSRVQLVLAVNVCCMWSRDQTRPFQRLVDLDRPRLISVQSLQARMMSPLSLARPSQQLSWSPTFCEAGRVTDLSRHCPYPPGWWMSCVYRGYVHTVTVDALVRSWEYPTTWHSCFPTCTHNLLEWCTIYGSIYYGSHLPN